MSVPSINPFTAISTVVSSLSSYAYYGPPSPGMTLRQFMTARLFRKLAGTALIPANDQSVMARRLQLEFPKSVTSRAELVDPADPKYYQGELSHSSVQPDQVPIFYLTPKKKIVEGKVVLYFHGGGYGTGDASGLGLASLLANRLGRYTVTVDYRLGNTEPFPAAVQDCITAYCHLRKTYSPDQIILAGESAGGGLVLATLLHLRELGEMPYKAILISPLITTSPAAPSFRKFGTVDFIDAEGLKHVSAQYVSLRPESRYIQFFSNTFEGLCPLFVSYGDTEVLSDDIREFCAVARRNGVEVVQDVGSGKVHVWIALPFEQQVTRKVWSDAAAFIDSEKAKL